MASLANASPSPAKPSLLGAVPWLLAALASSALLFWAAGDWRFSAAFLAGLLGVGATLLLLSPRAPLLLAEAEPAEPVPDAGLLRAALDAAATDQALAITDADDRMIAANQLWTEWFGGAASPTDLPAEPVYRERLREAALAARREGRARIGAMTVGQQRMAVEVRRAGPVRADLVWRFARSEDLDLPQLATRLLAGDAGRRMGEAGIMGVLTDAAGHILASNPVFALRALGDLGAAVENSQLADLLVAGTSGEFRFASEGLGGGALRLLHMPVGEEPQPLSLFLILDETGAPAISDDEAAHLHFLLDSLPLGLALADGDGRFSFLNKAFRRAAGLGGQSDPVWPGDLVVDEDKAAVSDAVRRFSRGRVLSTDMAVRLRTSPEEPVALTVAGARGLGNAAVLLSLKDNTEEARLKREIAQATKMQAVGQLAGGVAHDFNNILTAILGTCDLMLMRHAPGDSDYDDIQQIRSNSNRAANLTRQLLAFSRQQTLRPQVLQLPDVVSEVSHLLTRLLGERVRLEVKHGRGLGAVRADPGQLEQVIVNLAVNARDAILAKDPQAGGTLTIQTASVSAEEIRRMGSEFVPLGEYTALKVTDTGTGIAPDMIGKIFEPFFTTKEVGKGTGLGLSTVYGIVKQSGGFIFADSELGKGTSFTMYLPVHRAQPGEPAPKAKARDKPAELWGTGTILLVEDEVMVRTVAERALTRHGYTVLCAENGEAALEVLAREEGIDLMVSDVVMPTMDGPTTAREARKSHPDLPILFISGYAEEQLRKSINLDNVAFLAKPFSVQKLAETVRDVLNAK